MTGFQTGAALTKPRAATRATTLWEKIMREYWKECVRRESGGCKNREKKKRRKLVDSLF